MNEAELDRIISEVVANEAQKVDQDGVFPSASIDALMAAGFLSITVPKEFGGEGEGLGAAATVVRKLANVCSSTAMIVTMHYAATSLLSAVKFEKALREIAERKHLTTLAFSEAGSRSHFWAPLSTATPDGEDVLLNAKKSFVTSAHEANSYVWSSKPIEATDKPTTLWYVPRDTPGITVIGGFDGLGLRGNDSCPVIAENARIPFSNRLGEDGQGAELSSTAILPWFLTLNASNGVGLMQAVSAAALKHLNGTRLEHLGQTLAQQPAARTRLATMRVETDRTAALVNEAVKAVDEGSPDAGLLILEAKAASDVSSSNVADLAMQACGGAAFRKDLSIERRFRDSRAARVMAPTTDSLYEFIATALVEAADADAAEEKN